MVLVRGQSQSTMRNVLLDGATVHSETWQRYIVWCETPAVYQVVSLCWVKMMPNMHENCDIHL